MTSLLGSQRVASSSATPVRVASIPANHVYVRHLSAPHDESVVRLSDPDPSGGGRSAVSTWWPPVMLEANWVSEHASEFDIAHLHFGFDARSPQQLEEWADALRDAERPLVYTVHDLRNPHHDTPHEHNRQLDVLIPRADALVTLTEGAADEIERRWGRRPAVIPHPHVVDLETMADAARLRDASGGPFRIGVHVKSLRASMNPLPVLETLARVAVELDAVLQINGHTDVMTLDGARHNPELTALIDNLQAPVDVRVHDFMSDDELWRYLASLDVSVLPYRFGTHSGWLEACRDLGTAVVAPTCGYYLDQGATETYGHNGSHFDGDSLAEAVRRIHRTGAPLPLSPHERLHQRRQIDAAYTSLYRRLLQ